MTTTRWLWMGLGSLLGTVALAGTVSTTGTGLSFGDFADVPGTDANEDAATPAQLDLASTGETNPSDALWIREPWDDDKTELFAYLDLTGVGAGDALADPCVDATSVIGATATPDYAGFREISYEDGAANLFADILLVNGVADVKHGLRGRRSCRVRV